MFGNGGVPMANIGVEAKTTSYGIMGVQIAVCSTNTGEIVYRLSSAAATNVYVAVLGWTDRRGKE
jgi:hypothetical protein